MERYSLIHDKFPREFVLLQGTGCRWGRCTFCDYHKDVSEFPYELNKTILQRVTGCYGVLDIINSGSGVELDDETLGLIKDVIQQKKIHTVWFEMHYMYRNRLADFAAQFAPAKVKFRCGIESFHSRLRKKWNKGIPGNVSPEEIARYFQGVCLLCATDGDSRDRILSDIAIAKQYFEYCSVNVFCSNSTSVKRDEELARWFEMEILPALCNDSKVEVLMQNTDLGVG